MDPRRKFVLGMGAGAIVIAVLGWLLRGDGEDGGATRIEAGTRPERTSPTGVLEPSSEVARDGARRETLDEPRVGWTGIATGRLVLDGDRPVAGVQAMAIAYLRTEDPAEHLAVSPTDADGRFRIEGLRPDLYYTIALRAPDYVIAQRERPFLVLRDHANDLGFVLVEPLQRVHGRVIDGAGRPLSGAVVSDVHRRFLPAAPTDASGAFELRIAAACDVILRSELDGFVHRCRTTDWFRLDAASADSTIVLEMVRERPIRGRVVDLSGAPIRGARVTLTTQPKNVIGELGPNTLSIQLDETSTDDEGWFRSRAPEGDGAWIDVFAGPGAFGGKSLAADESECQITVERERPLRVRCVDAVTGEKVPARALWEVSAELEHIDIQSWGPRTSSADAEITELLVYFHDAGRARVAAWANGYSIGISDLLERGKVRREDPPEIEIRLRRGGEVAGSVIDPSGRPIRGMVVDLEPAGANPRTRSRLATKSDERGGFRFPSIEGHSFQVAAYYASGRLAARVPVVTSEALVSTESILVVTPSGALRGHVHDRGVAIPSVSIVEVPQGRKPTEFAETNSAGQFFVEELPTGPIALALFAGINDKKLPVLSNTKSVTIEDGKTSEWSFDLAETEFALVRGTIRGRGSEFDRWYVSVDGPSRTWHTEARGGSYLAGPLVAGTYSITVTAAHTGETISRRTVEIAPRARLTVDFEIDTGVLVGRLILPKDRAVAALAAGSAASDDFEVTLAPFVAGADIELAGSGARSFLKRIADETGAFRFTQVAAGEYLLRVCHASPEVDLQAERVVQITAQTTTRAELDLEPSGALEIRTPPIRPDEQPISSLRIRLVRADGVTTLVPSDRATPSDPFPFRKLAPGRYTLTVVNDTGSGFEDGPSAEITIVSGVTTQWVIPELL